MLSLGPGELGLLLTIWMDDPLYTSCRNRFPIFHKISAISHMIFTNILPHIKSYKHHEIHLLFGKPPPRFDLTSCFILQVKDGKATATYSRKLACLAILHASTCSCKCKPICFFSAMASHKTELSQVLTTLADVVWLISWSFDPCAAQGLLREFRFWCAIGCAGAVLMDGGVGATCPDPPATMKRPATLTTLT